MQKEFNSVKSFTGYFRNKRFKNIIFIFGHKSFFSTGASKDFDIFLKDNNCFLLEKKKEKIIYEDLIEQFNKYKEKDIDCIISIGGGSAIDLGKFLKFFLAYKRIIFETEERYKKKIFHVVIPTTAGSGSERTRFAVAYRNNIKISLDNKLILPDAVVFNKKYLMVAPEYVKACSVFDGLSQAVESIWAVRATKLSRKYAFEAIKLYKKNMFRFLISKELLYAGKVQQAASLAGKAINITRTTGPHALSYFLTADLGIPHGHAVALLLKEFLEFNYTYGDKKTKKNILEIILCFSVKDIQSLCDLWISFMKKAGLKTRIKDILNVELDFKKALSRVNLERLGNNPVSLGKKDIKKIYLNIW